MQQSHVSVLGRHGGGTAVTHYPDQPFLGGAGHQHAVAGEELPASQAARALRGRAIQRVQQLVVGAERAMEPQRVI